MMFVFSEACTGALEGFTDVLLAWHAVEKNPMATHIIGIVFIEIVSAVSDYVGE